MKQFTVMTVAENLNEVIKSELVYGSDNYQLIEFGTIQRMFCIRINGIQQKKIYKRLPKDLKEFFKIK